MQGRTQVQFPFPPSEKKKKGKKKQKAKAAHSTQASDQEIKNKKGLKLVSPIQGYFFPVEENRVQREAPKERELKPTKPLENLALSITACTEVDLPSKHLAFLSFQRDQMIAKKEKFHKILPLFKSTANLQAKECSKIFPDITHWQSNSWRKATHIPWAERKTPKMILEI